MSPKLRAPPRRSKPTPTPSPTCSPPTSGTSIVAETGHPGAGRRPTGPQQMALQEKAIFFAKIRIPCYRSCSHRIEFAPRQALRDETEGDGNFFIFFAVTH